MPKCRYCQSPTTKRFGLTYACGIDHAMAYAERKRQIAAERDRRRFEQEQNKANREAKESLKTLEKLCQEARVVVQRYCRLRDEQWGNCICCGVPQIDDGAHFYPVGSKYRISRLSLNPDQIHGACARCNRFVGGGSIEGYKMGLIVRYGEVYLDILAEWKRRADHGDEEPLTKQEVIQIKKDYLARIRKLKKQRDC